MKRSPQSERLENLLRSSKLVAGGFMGSDMRPVEEIIGADLASLERLGRTPGELAARMQEISNLAKAGLGTWVDIGGGRRAMVEEAKGFLICPWPHVGRYDKRVTILDSSSAGAKIRWSDLNIHLIGTHGFFEGKGSGYRLEPEDLVKFVFVEQL